MRLLILGCLVIVAVFGNPVKRNVYQPGILKISGALPSELFLRIKRHPDGGLVCTPGHQVDHCVCADDGWSWRCKRDVADQVDTSKIQGQEVGNDEPCEPAKEFKKYCNTCTCASDGISVACTRDACPPGVWNEDGTLKVPQSVE